MSFGKTITLSNGAKLPRIGLGTWLSETNEVEKAVRGQHGSSAATHLQSRSKSLSAMDTVTSTSR